MNEVMETEDQRDTRFRQARTRRALLLAPDLSHEMATLTLPTGGATERGEWVPEARIPFRGRVYDDLNDLYAVLVEGSTDFAPKLGQPYPTASYRWQVRDDEGMLAASVLGLPQRYTPASARELVRSLALWFVGRVDKIEPLPGGLEFFDDLTRLIWTLRHRYRLTPDRLRDASVFPCPVCGGVVVVRFFGEPIRAAEERRDLYVAPSADDRLVPDQTGLNPKSLGARQMLDVLAGVTVECTICAWAPAATGEQLVKWMDGDRRTGYVLPPGIRDLADAEDTLWSLDAAARHFGVKPRTIRAWIRDGSVVELLGGWLRREDLLAAFIASRAARNATLYR